MIHAFALDPRLVATWGRLSEFRFIHDKFGLGTPRALLELPKFSTWKREVYTAATALALSEEDMKRIEELFRLLGEHKCRRADSVYDGLVSWLENAEREHDRKPFAAILATENPRGHHAVLVGAQIGPGDERWARPLGATPARTPRALADTLSAMLTNSRELHLVDPHFGPENPRHRSVLVALMEVLSANGVVPEIIRVHCSEKSKLEFFEQEAARMARALPMGIVIEFARWKQRGGGEKLHNRYVLTNLGGVSLGVGLDGGEAGETDDLLLLPREQYELRWAQYTLDDAAFDRVDTPAKVQRTRTTGASKGTR